MEKVIARAAESIIIRKRSIVVKRRIAKGYRIPELDEKIRKLRTRQESKLLEKANKIISSPKIIRVDEKTKEIEMEFIQGDKLADMKLDTKTMEKVGEEVAKLHDNNIIHGDLTTSNMILVRSNQTETGNPQNKSKKSANNPQEKNKLIQVYILDFGLGFVSTRLEDRAVDLHLLKQALEAKHFENWEKLYSAFLKGYKSRDKEKTLKQLEKVESRGRYKN